MARGRFKGWKSPKAIAAMTPEQKAEYDALVEKVNAEREAEKKANGSKTFDAEVAKAKREEKQINLKNLISSQMEYQKTHIMSQDEDEEEKNGKPWYQEDDSLADKKETNINHLSGEGFCIIESNEDFWVRKIAEMIEKTPDKVIVLTAWCNEDMIRVKIPYSCMKKIKTSQRVVSEKERKRMSELGKIMGKKRGRKKKSEEENTELENAELENTEAEVTKPEIQEESDEEFEGTPMNKYRDYEEETTEEFSDEDDDITYAVMPSISFGADVKKIREHETPKAIRCDTADNEDYELYEDDDDYDKYE